MSWKRVAWAGCLAPVLGGCHLADRAPPGRAEDRMLAHAEKAIQHEIHKDAREAWRAVRAEFPRRCFTAEFREGFLDGYSDYLDRVGDAQPPAVPPLRYTRHQKYYTPEGHALLKDYFLGFKYGADVAVATGQRQYLTVPVLVAEGATHATIVEPQTAAAAPLPAPRQASSAPAKIDGAVIAIPPATKSPTPATKGSTPKPPADAGGSKFDAPWRLSDPVLLELDGKLPPPFPPLPMPTPPTPAVVAGVPVSAVPGGPSKFPDPPAEVPSFPPHVPTPPADDDLPVIPPNHTAPPPLPANHPEPMRK